MTERVGEGGGVTGFSLVELVLALLLFQVGLLAVAGMVLTAQEMLQRSHLVLRSTLEMTRVGDSILSLGGGEGGDLNLMWGRLAWEPMGGSEGSLRIWVVDGSGTDTLATLQLAPPACPGWGLEKEALEETLEEANFLAGEEVW
jgi:hypothetical protein